VSAFAPQKLPVIVCSSSGSFYLFNQEEEKKKEVSTSLPVNTTHLQERSGI
jgi:hypothetical protein